MSRVPSLLGFPVTTSGPQLSEGGRGQGFGPPTERFFMPPEPLFWPLADAPRSFSGPSRTPRTTFLPLPDASPQDCDHVNPRCSQFVPHFFLRTRATLVPLPRHQNCTATGGTEVPFGDAQAGWRGLPWDFVFGVGARGRRPVSPPTPEGTEACGSREGAVSPD